MAKTKIADLSHYQGKIDWSKAAVELAFCILRASVGVNTDKKYAEYVQGCKENGIPFHAYHYLKATTTEEAVEEAQHFYKAASAAEPLFYVADVEYGKIPASSARAITSAFISELKRLGAKRTAIYVGHHLFNKFNLATGEVDYLWIPRYGKNSGTPETRPSYPCDLWQYTSNGKLAGVSGRVDLNQLTGTKPLSYFTDLAQPDEEPKKGGTAMAYDPKKVIAIAEAEVGYLEKASNKNLDSKTANAGSKNYTKYARDMDAIPNFYNGKKQGVAWCDIFVDWCFVQAYGVEAARALLCQPLKSSGAGCKYSRGYYKAKGQLHTSNPQPGDQIFFWPSDRSDPNAVAHTGLVYAVDKTYVYTIEGNTSGASGVISNGGGVCKKKYKLNNSRIAGYGRPAYDQQASTPTTPTTPSITFKKLGSRMLRNGDKGDDVKELQTALKTLGYFNGDIGGNYLTLTTQAVKAFQKANGLEVDGIFGPKSLAALVECLKKIAPPEPAPTPPEPAPAPPTPPASEPTYTLTIQGTKAALEAIQAQYGGTLAAADPEE